jgi:hypothetical protein
MLFLREAIISDTLYKKVFNFLYFNATSTQLEKFYTHDQIVASSTLWFYNLQECCKEDFPLSSRPINNDSITGKDSSDNFAKSSENKEYFISLKKTKEQVDNTVFLIANAQNVDFVSPETNEKQYRHLISSEDPISKNECLEFELNQGK